MMMARQSRRMAWIAVVALMLSSEAGGATQGSESSITMQAGDYGDDGEKAVPEALRRTSEPIIFDAYGLRERLASVAGESFGGLHGDEDGSLVVLATPGNAPTLEAEIEKFIQGQNASVECGIRDSPNAFRRLEDLYTLLMELPASDRDALGVTLFGVDDRANALLVGLAIKSADARFRLLQRLGAADGEVVFEQQEVTPPIADRFSDSPPWNAGNRIYGENSGLKPCSTGFGVHDRNTSKDYLLTAAHCSDIAGQADFFWNGNDVIRRRRAVGFSRFPVFGNGGPNAWDTQLIDTESSTVTWTAAATRSYITAAYTPVAYDANLVINEGATSIPWQSGSMRVVATNFCVAIGPYNPWGTVTICNLWRAFPTNTSNCAAQNADSGGPVVSYSGFGPLAIGQNVAGSCSSVYFHSVGHILSRSPHGVPLSINTTSDPG